MTQAHPEASAWRWLTLARLLDPDGRFDTPPSIADTDWLGLYRFTTGHLVAPTLYATLAARDRLGWLPGEVAEALEGLHLLNAARNRGLSQVLHETTATLNAVGIRPIALKGAIALLPGQPEDQAARVLSDLDLGIGEADLPTAIAALRDAGYRRPAGCYPGPEADTTAHHHAPPLMHPSGAGYVELHRHTLSAAVPAAALPLASLAAAATTLTWDGVQLRLPTLAHRLIHNSLHHQISDRALLSDRRSLRQLLDFARLRGLPEAAALDWPALLTPLDALGVGDALRLDLLATRTLFDQPLPVGVVPTPAALAAEGRFWLRRAQPRLDRLLDWQWRTRVLAGRLANLPKRLVTPSWYPAKFFYLRQAWRTKHRGAQH